MINFREKVEDIVKNEVSCIKEEYGEKYHTAHEAYGVLKEEVEECSEEYSALADQLNYLWRGIRVGFKEFRNFSDIRTRAINLACEAIQVAAVCEKALQGVEKDG